MTHTLKRDEMSLNDCKEMPPQSGQDGVLSLKAGEYTSVSLGWNLYVVRALGVRACFGTFITHANLGMVVGWAHLSQTFHLNISPRQ